MLVNTSRLYPSIAVRGGVLAIDALRAARLAHNTASLVKVPTTQHGKLDKNLDNIIDISGTILDADSDENTLNVRESAWLSAALAVLALPPQEDASDMPSEPTAVERIVRTGAKRFRIDTISATRTSSVVEPLSNASPRASLQAQVRNTKLLAMANHTIPPLPLDAINPAGNDEGAKSGAFDIEMDDFDMDGSAAGAERARRKEQSLNPPSSVSVARVAAASSTAGVEAAIRAGLPPPLGTLDEEIAAIRTQLRAAPITENWRQRLLQETLVPRADSTLLLADVREEPTSARPPRFRRWGSTFDRPLLPPVPQPRVASVTSALLAAPLMPGTHALSCDDRSTTFGEAGQLLSPLLWVSTAQLTRQRQPLVKTALFSAALAAENPALSVAARAFDADRRNGTNSALCVEFVHAAHGRNGGAWRAVGSVGLSPDAKVSTGAAPTVTVQTLPAASGDLLAQCLFAVPEGTADALLLGAATADRDAPPLAPGADAARAAGGAAAAALAARLRATSQYPHAQPAVDLSFAPNTLGFRCRASYVSSAAAIAALEDAESTAVSKTRRTRLQLAAEGAVLSIRSCDTNATAASTFGVSIGGAVRVSGGASAPHLLRRRGDLTASDGDVLLFEYSEAHPLLRIRSGMAVRIVTYARGIPGVHHGTESGAAPPDDFDDDAGATLRGLAADEGVVQQIWSQDGYPLLGGIELGERVTTLVTPLFAAPLLKHRSRDTDLLLILRPPPVAIPGQSSIGGPVLLFVREIRKLYLVGQEEPSVHVFRPMLARQMKGSGSASESASDEVRRALTAYQLLVWMRAEDDALRAAVVAARHAAMPSAIGVEYNGRASGVVLLSDALKRFGLTDVEADTFLNAVDDVVDLDDRNGVLRRKKNAPSPEEYREMHRLTPERICLLEAQAAGVLALRAAGVITLLNDDKALDDALAKLTELYDRLVGRLKASAAGQGIAHAAHRPQVTVSSAGDESWQHDGVYRRMRRTLEIAQAVYYLLQTTPWATSHNYLAYTRRGDSTMLALQDPGGVGDPSGRGEAFSFIRDIGARRVASALAAAAAAGLGDAAHSRREGTERDVRILTNVQAAEMLVSMGARPEAVARMKRWERIRSIREKQNEQLSLGRSATGPGGAPLLFAGEIARQTPEQRRIAKVAQAKEVARRQIEALGSADVKSVDANDNADDDDDDSEDDDEFAADLERVMEANIRRAGTGTTARRTTGTVVADDAEKAEFDSFLKHAGVRTGAASAAAVEVVAGNIDSAMVDGSVVTFPRGGVLSASIHRHFSLPQELIQAPHAPLLASYWAGGVRGGALPSATRTGARNPMWLGSIPIPPQPPVIVDDARASATNAPAAAGTPSKLLRIVRTTVDADGRQVRTFQPDANKLRFSLIIRVNVRADVVSHLTRALRSTTR